MAATKTRNALHMVFVFWIRSKGTSIIFSCGKVVFILSANLKEIYYTSFNKFTLHVRMTFCGTSTIFTLLYRGTFASLFLTLRNGEIYRRFSVLTLSVKI